MRPACMTTMRSASAISSDQIGRDDEDAGAGVGESREDGVDLVLGGDVDAAGRLVDDEDFRIGLQPPREQRLLLVAARESRDGTRPGSGALMPSAGDRRSRDRSLRALRMDAAPRHFPEATRR